jgi:hypothetical protein
LNSGRHARLREKTGEVMTDLAAFIAETSGERVRNVRPGRPGRSVRSLRHSGFSGRRSHARRPQAPPRYYRPGPGGTLSWCPRRLGGREAHRLR